MKKIKNITIIGSGNVGSHLAKALYKSGTRIKQIYSRSYTHAESLAEVIDATPINKLTELDDQVDLLIIAVKDDAIQFILEQIRFRDVLIVHTSGSIPMDVFNSFGYTNFGIFYPLQSFNKNKTIQIDEVPFCLEANNKKSLLAIETLAKTISNQVYQINSKEREVLHLAAVFANNFTNYMFQVAKEITEDNNLSFDILKPLIYETADKLKTLTPKEAQTGPANRNDQKTIEKHKQLLEKSPKLKALYKNITNQIINSSNQPK